MVAKCAIVGSHSMNEFLPGSVEVLVLQRRVPAPGHVIMTPVDMTKALGDILLIVIALP